MRRNPLTFASAIVVLSNIGSLVYAQDLTPLPEPIGPSQSLPVLPEPVVAAPVAGTAGASNKVEAAKVRVQLEREAIKSSAELVLPRLLSHELTVQEAWEKKLIRAPHIEYLLGEYLHPWGGFGWTMDVELRRALVKQLLSYWEQSAPEKLQAASLSEIKPQVRLWIADYLQNAGDERIVDVAESLIRQFPALQTKVNLKDEQGVNGFEALVFQTCERLGWYYGGKSEYSKAAETWLKVEALLPEQSWKKWLVPDSLIEAARSYSKVPSIQKAEDTYKKASISEDEFLAAGALLEMCNLLIQQNQVEKARIILAERLQYKNSLGLIAHAVLAYLAYQNSDNKAVEFHVLQAQGLLRSPQNRQQLQSNTLIVQKAEEILRLSQQWQKQPLVCDPVSVDMEAGSDVLIEPITRRVLVNSFNQVPLEVQCPAGITVRIEESPWLVDVQPQQYQQQLVIDIAPELLQKEDTASLTISSSALANYKLNLPINVIYPRVP